MRQIHPILAQASGRPTGLWILTIVCLVICVGLGYFGWKLLGRLRNLEAAARQKAPKAPPAPSFSPELGRLRADLATLQRRISMLEKASPPSPSATPPRPTGPRREITIPEGAEPPIRRPQPPPRPETPAARQAPRPQEEGVFYMAFPINNYFLDKGKSLSKDNMVYRFKVNGDGNEATFSVSVAGPQLIDIMKRVETFLRPACQEDNLPGSAVKAIQTREPGVAVLQGDKWLIKTKAVIRYE
jgi:hypothetical protein